MVEAPLEQPLGVLGAAPAAASRAAATVVLRVGGVGQHGGDPAERHDLVDLARRVGSSASAGRAPRYVDREHDPAGGVVLVRAAPTED